MPVWAFVLTCSLAAVARLTAQVAIVGEGKALAVVVTADRPTAVATYAAEELVYHIKKATGMTLSVIREGDGSSSSQTRIYLGATKAAAVAGIDVPKLAPETFALKTVDNALFIAGGDGAGDPLDVGTFAGTLLGVYEWLERDLGARWLWPGDLGTYVPQSKSVAARKVDAVISPKFFQRNVRGGLTFKATNSELGFTANAAEEYAHAQTVYLRRCRMGKSVRLSYRHAFTDWWAKYGATHPEWFQLVNGKRGPTKPGGSYSMCVSNPEFQKEVVRLWWEARQKSGATAGGSFLNAVENGIMGLCECENCRALDGPEPGDFLKHYSPKSKMMGSRYVTDRYVRFWLAVQKEAEKYDPTVTVVAYNYFNYFYRPSPGLKLNDRFLIGSYPSSGWFPRSTEEQVWFKDQWRGWQATGARLFSRGNYCLDGYNMPLIFAHQFVDEFHSQLESGMVATDYDALTGQWSTQGPNIYVLMRLHTKPEASADDLLAEYYSAFGAAAPLVKKYFDYWETYALENRERINQAFIDLDASRWRSWAIAAHVVFPPETFEHAGSILAEAAAAVQSDEEAGARVGFLKNGLTHARLSARAAALLTVADPGATVERGYQALRDLITFRQAHEREWLGNFNHSAWIEEASWRLPGQTKPLTQTETNKL
ncbi:DUF4838 domain-containing protein [Nibricoccus aquaticus]|nr:DUF4838 domain-containing protein [Nibricoccus aquaticus]